jgi:hypothetical protein
VGDAVDADDNAAVEIGRVDLLQRKAKDDGAGAFLVDVAAHEGLHDATGAAAFGVFVQDVGHSAALINCRQHFSELSGLRFYLVRVRGNPLAAEVNT